MRAFLRGAWALVMYDYRVRFGRTLLGMLWLLLPLVALVGAAMVVGHDAGLYETGQARAYLARLVVGLIVWQLFADCWLEPLRLGRRANTILRGVSFEHRMLIGAGALSALVALAVKLPVLVGVLIWLGVPPTWSWLSLPFGLVGCMAAGSALACMTLPVSLVLLDVRYAMPLAQYAALLVTPIFYEPPQGLLGQINRWNPLTYLAPAVRDVLTGTGVMLPVFIGATIAFVLLLAALRYFGRRMGLAVSYVGL